MYFNVLAIFSNGTKKRSVSFQNDFKTFEKRIQTLTTHLNETSLIRCNGKHSQDIPTLSMIELQKENSELWGISALHHSTI